MDVKVGLWRKLSTEELMLLNCGFGEDSWGSLDCKEIQPVHSEGDQSWVFFGRNDAKAETPVLWLPHAKSWLVGSPCSPRDSQESSLTPQFKTINSSALGFLHSPTLTSIHDHWKNHILYFYRLDSIKSYYKEKKKKEQLIIATLRNRSRERGPAGEPGPWAFSAEGFEEWFLAPTCLNYPFFLQLPPQSSFPSIPTLIS